jgi:hypothetical protein
MKTEILLITFKRHLPWADYCIRSIAKFGSGFSALTILVPHEDVAETSRLTECGLTFPSLVKGYDEWPGKGMIHHMAQIMRADEWCPQADFILHTDSDCIFSEPFSPEDYFVNGKPVLMHASFKWLINTQQANLEMWQRAVAAAVGWKPSEETMRRHPAVHPRKIYAKARECIEAHTKMPCDDYIKSCENAFPQTFAEFPALGAVAWRFFHNDYHWIDQQREPFPHGKLAQFWGHAPPDQPQEPVVRGKPFRCTPADLLKA